MVGNRKKDITSIFLKFILRFGAFITASALLFIVGYILVKGVPYLKPELFSMDYNSTNHSMLPSILNTLIMVAITLVIAVPIGVATAIFLAEYSKSANIVVRTITLAADTLAGIPSIVYGLFGMLFFVVAMNWGYSLMAGAFTLALMVLPVIIRTTQEALMSIPDSYREGSCALGAGKLRTVMRITLPCAMNGILSGVILATGRAVGETAALIFTAGTVAKLVGGSDFLMDSARTLSVHMYVLANEGLYVNQSYATAVVLLLVVLTLNAVSSLISKLLMKGKTQ